MKYISNIFFKFYTDNEFETLLVSDRNFLPDRRGRVAIFFPARDHEGVNILPRPLGGCSPPSVSSGVKADMAF